ncbi:MAG: hypothetical protein IPO83_00190 [Chitinophagaceae bacterium]|nr:hypothetical protein [Chitinophagaceae bacterium]
MRRYFHFKYCLVFLFFFSFTSMAQLADSTAKLDNITTQTASSDSTKKKLPLPNNIKLNISANILYSPAFIFTYERTVKPHQTFSVQAGYITSPKLFSGLGDSLAIFDSLSLINSKSQFGFKLGADYRFYFKKENKYEAPRGLYWGPFSDFYNFDKKGAISINDTSIGNGTVNFETRFRIVQVGINLGYQFVVKKRLSIDLVLFGPALSLYSFGAKIDGDFDLNEENKYVQALYDKLISGFPVLAELADEQQVNTNGRIDLFSAGFRYSVNVGFRF